MSETNDVVILELWNHGTAGEVSTSCGEICVFNISGTKLPLDLIEKLADKNRHSQAIEWYEDLPTEQALRVEAELYFEDGDPWLQLKKWEAIEV